MRDEAELIEGIREQESGVFEEFVWRYQQRVYFTALRMIGDRDDALDAAQEVFLKIWRHAWKTPESPMLERWVYRVTVNACIDRLRCRRREEVLTVHDNVILFNLAAMSADPHELAQQAEQFQRIKKAMDELTERQRAVFVLRHFQNLKLQEIADVLETPVGTVKATLHQSLMKLRGLLHVGANESPECAQGKGVRS